MKNIKAFPFQFEDVTGAKNWLQSEGMDLRDYFAAQFISSVAQNSNEGFRYSWPEYATMAYQVADEMMKARQS
jgi:hypothetical protein